MTQAPHDPSPGLKLGSIAGVPVYLGRSWPIIALFIVAAFGPGLVSRHPEWGMGAYALAFAFALLLLFSVLVHEGSHAVTGKLCGFKVQRIVADLMGGHTAYGSESPTPGKSALVAIVGPVSNAVLAIIGFLLLRNVDAPVAVAELLRAFTWTNGFVAFFNALPGLPLDGGFVVDAFVWKLTGSRAKGLQAAGWCGRIVAVLVVVWALLPLTQGQGLGSLWTLAWTLFIAMFLWRGASTAVTVGNNRQFLAGIRVADVIQRVDVVDGRTPIAQVPDTGLTAVVVDEHGAPIGTLAPDAHVNVPFERRPVVPASALSHTLAPGSIVGVESLDLDLTALLGAFAVPEPPERIIVTAPSSDGQAIVGMTSRDAIERAMVTHAQRLKSSS